MSIAICANILHLQVLHSQVKTSVKRLTKTFVTLSLSELATRVGLENAAAAEKLVVRMIEQVRYPKMIEKKLVRHRIFWEVRY